MKDKKEKTPTKDEKTSKQRGEKGKAPKNKNSKKKTGDDKEDQTPNVYQSSKAQIHCDA